MSRLYHRLQVAANLIKKDADRRLLDAAGLTTAQAAALAVIREERESTQRLVARRLHVSEPAMATMVDRLVAAGLVERRRDVRDRRVRLLRLSAAGDQTLAHAEGVFATVNTSLEDALGAQGVAQLEARLQQLVRHLGESHVVV